MIGYALVMVDQMAACIQEKAVAREHALVQAMQAQIVVHSSHQTIHRDRLFPLMKRS